MGRGSFGLYYYFFSMYSFKMFRLDKLAPYSGVVLQDRGGRRGKSTRRGAGGVAKNTTRFAGG